MQVCKLRPEEVVRVNTALLEGLGRHMGMEDAEAVVCAAMEDLAELLYQADIVWKAKDLERLDVLCRRISSMAEGVGMNAVAQVAQDVTELCCGQDDNAIAATVARLRRVGERSLLAIWDVQQTEE